MTQMDNDNILHNTTNSNGIHKAVLNHAVNRTGTPLSNKSNSLSPPHVANSSTTGSAGQHTPNPRSCVTCRRRKVKCDKQHPCSNCKKAHIDCVFPGPGRAVRRPRRAQDNAELIERLKKLEGVVQSLGGNGADDHAKIGVSALASQFTREDSSSTTSGKVDAERKDSGVHSPSSVRTGLERPFGQLEIEKGRSLYVEEPIWSTVVQEVENLKTALNVSSDDEGDSEIESPSPSTGASPNSTHQSFIFGYRSENVNMAAMHPPAELIPIYWDLYVQNLDQIVKVLHIPSFAPLILQAKDNLENIPRSMECMMFAIYYGVVTSLWPEEVRQKLGGEKEELLERYRFACEQAFARASFLQTDEYRVIQAFVTFLMVLRFHICLRRNDDARITWTLTGLIIRMAQTMGLHKDGTHHNLSPFRTEMRRRLWWQICILDARTSEDHGCESTLTPDSFDTKMPVNVDDDRLDPDMTEIPEEQHECTQISFSLVRSEIIVLLKKLSHQAPGAKQGKDSVPSPAAIEEKEKIVEQARKKIHEKYLVNADPNSPIRWIVDTVSKQILSKANLLIYHPFQRHDGGLSLPLELRDRLFRTSVENLENSLALQQEAKQQRWGWIFRIYTQWHAIAFVLSELRWRVNGELVERAWHAVEEAMSRRAHDNHTPIPNQNDHSPLGQMWKPLRRLMVVARKARARELDREKKEREVIGWVPEANNLDPMDPIMSLDLGVDRLYPSGTAPGGTIDASSGLDPWGPLGNSSTLAGPQNWTSPVSNSDSNTQLNGANDTGMPQRSSTYSLSSFGQPPDWLINPSGNVDQIIGMNAKSSGSPTNATNGASSPFKGLPADATIAPDLLSNAVAANNSGNNGNDDPLSTASPKKAFSIGARTNSSSTNRESVDWETWDNLVQEFGMELDGNATQQQQLMQGMDPATFGDFGGLGSMGAVDVGAAGDGIDTGQGGGVPGTFGNNFEGWSSWY